MKMHKGRTYKDKYPCGTCGKEFDWPWELGGHIAGKLDPDHSFGTFIWRGCCKRCQFYEKERAMWLKSKKPYVCIYFGDSDCCEKTRIEQEDKKTWHKKEEVVIHG